MVFPRVIVGDVDVLREGSGVTGVVPWILEKYQRSLGRTAGV